MKFDGYAAAAPVLKTLEGQHQSWVTTICIPKGRVSPVTPWSLLLLFIHRIAVVLSDRQTAQMVIKTARQRQAR
jgi:hypothetical protein